ncbi:MAG: NAD-dependent epimerase/dehydratase family protein [Rhodospirillales bacterium]
MNADTSRSGTGRLVTIFGGAGYIGPVVAKRLLRQGYRVRVVDMFLYGTQNVLLGLFDEPGFEVVNGDEGEGGVLERALDGATDAVILAGLVGDPITKKYPDAHQAVNEDGIAGIIDALNGRGLKRAVFVSTCSNYGLIPEGTLADENYALNPLSLYAKAKVGMEQKLLGLAGEVDFEGVALRFATAFGLAPRMRFDLTVSQFTREMYLGNDLLVYDPDTWRPYCHVQDFADVIQRVLEAPGDAVAFDVFNAGGDANNATKRMIVEAIQKHLPGAPVAYQEHGSDPRNYRVDFAKIKDRLGFTPRYTVEDGIRELIAALEQDLFADVDARANFYGNYEIAYPAR